MSYKFFIISANNYQEKEKELNNFLQNSVVLAVKEEFTMLESLPVWMFCIEYISQNIESTASVVVREKTDFKSILDEEEYSVFLKLKEIRKRIATEDAVPAYAVFTNEELVEISKMKSISLDKFRDNPLLNKKRVEKYGQYFVL